MENISYVGLSQQIMLQRQMEMTANNIANMNTPGFKAQGLLFNEYLNRSGPGETLSQVSAGGDYRNLANGALQQTFNELDVAIEGQGYFTVQTPEGNRYTRNGSFSLNNNGEIVTKQGYPVLSRDGAPINIPEGSTHITITKKGDVSTNAGEAGNIGLVSFDNEQALLPVGENLYEAPNLNPVSVTEVHMEQGMIEGSNVNPIIEMNKMIEVLRNYQATARMMQNDHDRQLETIQKLSKT